MNDNPIIEMRIQAEKAVADMPDGELKVKAFEVILGQLLASRPMGPDRQVGPSVTVQPRGQAKTRGGRQNSSPTSLSERILSLRTDGFFGTPKPIGVVREGLNAQGWHYPVTTLSGALQSLVQRRQLRRQRVREGNKTGWKYSNP